MKPVPLLILLGLLFAVVWPVQGQTPTTAADYINRGTARKVKGDFDGAIADFTKAIEIDPRDAEAYYDRGTTWWVKQELDKTISDYTMAIEINPRYRTAYSSRGVARLAKCDFDGAIVDYTKVIALDPRYAGAYNDRGFARQSKGDLDGAIADFTKAIEIEPRQASAYVNRGSARDHKGDHDGANADFDKAIEINPAYAAGAYQRLAWLLATAYKETIRDGKRAVDYALKAAELTNWDPLIMITLAAAYAEAGKFEEAIKWQNKALSFPDWAIAEERMRLQLYKARRPYHAPLCM